MQRVPGGRFHPCNGAIHAGLQTGFAGNLRGAGLFGTLGERLQGQTGMQNRDALCIPLALLAAPV